MNVYIAILFQKTIESKILFCLKFKTFVNFFQTLTIPPSICSTSNDSEAKPTGGEIIDVVGSPSAHSTTI